MKSVANTMIRYSIFCSIVVLLAAGARLHAILKDVSAAKNVIKESRSKLESLSRDFDKFVDELKELEKIIDSPSYSQEEEKFIRHTNRRLNKLYLLYTDLSGGISK
jgi:septal ring factor EnvC (AmiA/AmiB activator)